MFHFLATIVEAQVKLRSPNYEIILYPPLVENDKNQQVDSGLLDRSEITKLKINGYQIKPSENVVNLSLNSNTIGWDDDKEINEKFLVVSTNSMNKLYIASLENKDAISDGKLPLFRCMQSGCDSNDVTDSKSAVIAFTYADEKSFGLFENFHIISLNSNSQIIDTNNSSIARLKLFKSKKSIPNNENKLTSNLIIFSRIGL